MERFGQARFARARKNRFSWRSTGTWIRNPSTKVFGTFSSYVQRSWTKSGRNHELDLMGPSLDNFISWSLFQLKVIWGQIKFDKSQLVTGFNNSLTSPVVKIAKPVYMDQCMVELGLSDWKSDFESFRRLLNVNLKILIFGSDKDWSSSVGSTTMLQKYFNPRRLTNQFFWRWTNISTRFLLVSYQETLNLIQLMRS